MAYCESKYFIQRELTIVMLDTLIGMVLLVYPITVFLAKGGSIILYSLLILLSLKVLKESVPTGKIIYTLIFCIVGYNFIKINEQKDYFGGALNHTAISSYAVTIIVIIMIIYMFSDFGRIETIYNFLYKRNIIILAQVIVSQLVILIMIITGKGYYFATEGRYFVGPFDTPHPYGYAMILMIIVIEWLYVIRKSHFILGLAILPIITSLLSGARTPAIFLLIIFLMMRLTKKERSINIKLFNLILVCIALTLSICFYKYISNSIMNSAFIEKFIYTFSKGNVSSGRNIFWNVLINTYLNEFDVLKKLFGNGIFSTMIINNRAIGMKIWAHSDFLDILISYGLVLLLIYIFLYVRFFYKLFIHARNKMLILSIFLGFIFLSAINGIANYSFIIGIFCYISFFIRDINNMELNLRRGINEFVDIC
jgi:hypothetical protein